MQATANSKQRQGEGLVNTDVVSQFYREQFASEADEKLSPECPFCSQRGFTPGELLLVLNPESYFHGYFRCSNRCTPGGFPLWFARQAGLPPESVPGFDPDYQPRPLTRDYPSHHINDEVESYTNRFPDHLQAEFHSHGIQNNVLLELGVGFNGRYNVFPYWQEDGNCYAARCVHPEKEDDYFWHGDERFSKPPFTLYNIQDIARCEGGALFICEGERNLLILRQMGFPGVAVSESASLEQISSSLFERISTIFILVSNRKEAESSARHLASRIGYRARLIRWGAQTPEGTDLWQLAGENVKKLGERFASMLKETKPFSPFTSPDREYKQFLAGVESREQEEYRGMLSGFACLDDALGGVHGINVIGGGPKVGKSTFLIQIASEMAGRKIPVLYYDFENGRQKIYQRTLSRISRLSTDRLHGAGLSREESINLDQGRKKLEKMMHHWRVINDRKVTPELMRKHVDFIRHETRSQYAVIVIDSLHKLPFKDFSEQRTGIDAWLREMEAIRDEMQVSFLVISELSREATDSYRATPHLGVFKGSGDIEYSADNAMVLLPSAAGDEGSKQKKNSLWLVASREHSPGRVAEYAVDFPYWGFTEEPPWT